MAQVKPGDMCPLLSGTDKKGNLVKVPCQGLECSWYMQVRGVHPQTGEDIDEWGCAVTWQPVLLIENSKMQRETGAAVESFRNEMSRQNRELLGKHEQTLIGKR